MARIAQPAHGSGAHQEEGFVLPNVTTPQGTQESGVEKGHEDRDINYRAVINWFVLLAVIAVFSDVVVFGGLSFLMKEAKKADQPPSAMFMARTTPPLPRLLPSPEDTSKLPPDVTLADMGPSHAMVTERDATDRQMAKLGLFDPATGQMTIPPSASASLRASGAIPTMPDGADSTQVVEDGAKRMMPSASSGGVTMEDQQR